MKNEAIESLKKVIFANENMAKKETSGCCGGPPVRNEDACCKLDEEKKAEEETGCGCNNSTETKVKSSCC